MELLPAVWQGIDKISDFHLKMVGTASAEKITDNMAGHAVKAILVSVYRAQHPEPELARLEHRKVICGDYVRVYKIMFTSTASSTAGRAILAC